MEASKASSSLLAPCSRCFGIRGTIIPTEEAREVSSIIIDRARAIIYTNEQEMWCPDCKCFPVLPVTGQCGHTRCTECIRKKSACPCGAYSPGSLHVNIFIQDLLNKMVLGMLPRAMNSEGLDESSANSLSQSTASTSSGVKMVTSRESLRHSARNLRRSPYKSVFRVPSKPKSHMRRLALARFLHAQDLIAAENYFGAATELACVAASSNINAKTARYMMAQTITVLCQMSKPLLLTCNLYQSLRNTSLLGNLEVSDFECVICYNELGRPVTTPCGHTICRDCLRKTLERSKQCPICRRSLVDFNLFETKDTSFISAAQDVIGFLKRPHYSETSVILLFKCTVAFPTISCPLLIFVPRFWEMIRQMLESGSRRFGMVPIEKGSSFSEYGTLLEVRDCVRFEDGRSILSTIGLSRFKVLEKDMWPNGCHMAYVEELRDEAPTVPLDVLQTFASLLSERALIWLSSLNKELILDIETTLGRMPTVEPPGPWWESPNGPEWLWWLIAIMPIKSDMQIMMLSTPNLYKRMLAVDRMFDMIQDITTEYDSNFNLPNQMCYVIKAN